MWFETLSWPSDRCSHPSRAKSAAKKAAKVATEKAGQKLGEKAAEKGSDRIQKRLRNNTIPSEASAAKLKQILENKVPRSQHLRTDNETKPNFGESPLKILIFYPMI